MSWITRCPDCDAVYKVASDQIHQAQGWLRCGTCQHVFDSAGRIVAAEVIPTLTDRIHVGAPQLGRVELEHLLLKESPSQATSLSDESPPVARPTPVASETSSIAAFENALQSFKRPDMPAPDVGTRSCAAEAALATPVRPVRDKRPGLGMFLVGLLMLVLMGQLWLALRPVLLTHRPQWGQWMAQWCTTVACRAYWQPPLYLWSLQAQPVVCDGEHCHLAWALRHSASAPLSVPHLTVTWLNPHGQSVTSPRLAVAPASLAAGQAWQDALQVDWPSLADTTRVQLRLVNR
jgi:predicted Zn finger-like uncharacterized protein